MKKTYFSPVTRSIDLSHETDILELSQINVDDEGAGDGEAITKGQGIWGWTNDDN